MSWSRATRLEELPEGRAVRVEVDDEPLLLCRIDGTVTAIEDTCSHDAGPLGEGTLVGHTLACPRHGATFDVRTGAALTMPAVAPVDRFDVRLTDDGWVEVDLELT